MTLSSDVIPRLGSYSKTVEKKRLLLAESHPLFRQAIVDVLAKIAGISLVAKVANGWDVIRTSLQLKPDIILMDFSLPGLSGLEVTNLVRRESPQILVVILLDEEDEKYIKAVEQSGAWAYLAKSQLAQELPSLLDELQRTGKANDSSNRTINPGSRKQG